MHVTWYHYVAYGVTACAYVTYGVTAYGDEDESESGAFYLKSHTKIKVKRCDI